MSFRQIWRLLLNKKLLVGISVSSRTPWPIELVPRQAELHKRNFQKNKNTRLIQLQLPNNCQKHARLKTENRNWFLPFIKYSEKPHSDETAIAILLPIIWLLFKSYRAKGIHSHNPRCFTVYLYPLSIQLELCYTIGNCIYCALYIWTLKCSFLIISLLEG